MAFLPTAAGTVIFWLVETGVLVSMLFFPSMFVSGILLMCIGIGCDFFIEMGAFRLYYNLMTLVESDFDRWYTLSQRVAKRCHGRMRIVVLLDIAEQLCRYERVNEAEDILRQIKPRVGKSGSARFRFYYLMMVLKIRMTEGSLKEKGNILSQMYQCLNVKSDWSKRELRKCRKTFEKMQVQVCFYTKSARQLATTDRRLTEIWHHAAVTNLKTLCTMSDEVDYEILTACYNVGLTYLLLGNEAAAVRYYRRIMYAPYDYPLTDRTRQYLRTADPSALLQTMT